MGWFSHFQCANQFDWGLAPTGEANSANSGVGWWADQWNQDQDLRHQRFLLLMILGGFVCLFVCLFVFFEKECLVMDSDTSYLSKVFWLSCGAGDKDDVSKLKIQGQKHTSLCLNVAMGRGLTPFVVQWSIFIPRHLMTTQTTSSEDEFQHCGRSCDFEPVGIFGLFRWSDTLETYCKSWNLVNSCQNHQWKRVLVQKNEKIMEIFWGAPVVSNRTRHQKKQCRLGNLYWKILHLPLLIPFAGRGSIPKRYPLLHSYLSAVKELFYAMFRFLKQFFL